MTAPSTTAPTHTQANPPDEWECSIQLTNNPRAPSIARTTIRTAMRDYGLNTEVTDTAELLTSELVTNAVKHADGPVFTRASTRNGTLRVSVWDNHPELPDALPLTTHDTFGRGLALIHHLATRWGHYPLGPTHHCGTPTGKVIWFELAL